MKRLEYWVHSLVSPDVRFEVCEYAEAKEAMLFALLAYLCVCGAASNIPSVTGAKGARILGKVSEPPPT
jgi:1,6-anhydro-N-acetylmuramate kinase